MQILARDLEPGMTFMIDDRLYRVVDIAKSDVLVAIDCRKQSDLGEMLSDFFFSPDEAIELPETKF
jgi:hypothetical protein